MAELGIYLAEGTRKLADDEALGFFGDAGFDRPISLNTYNGRTFVTNPSGSLQSLEVDNCKLFKNGEWDSINGPSGVIVGQIGSGISILNLPNYLATMNLRLTNGSPVLVQNANIVVHNGDEVNGVSGLSVYMAEVVHTSELQTDIGTGDFAWLEVSGINNDIGLSDSPGISGSFPVGGQDVRHDWYIAISVRPYLPGNKLFYMTFGLEYL